MDEMISRTVEKLQTAGMWTITIVSTTIRRAIIPAFRFAGRHRDVR
jgi:hypothetical protein